MITPVTGTPATHVTPPTTAPPEAKVLQQAAKQDQINVSKLAQKLASDGDTQAQEVKENGAERATEKARKKA
jgi:hypothetical protein